MMLRSKLCYLMPYFTSLNAITNHFVFSIRPSLYFSTLQTQNSSSKPHFMVDHLINSCGFSLDQANKVSNHLTHLKSPSKPDSVLQFFKLHGFSDTHIRKIICKDPKLLCSSVEKNLKRKFSAFQEMGFSQSDQIQLVLDNPDSLWYGDLQPRIEFLRSFLITNENIVKVLRKNHSLFGANLTERIMPNVSLLRDCGIPDYRIAKMVMNSSWFLSRSPSTLNAAIKKAEELGVSRHSGMFCHVLRCIVSTSRATLDAKFKLFESFGWSEAETIAALVRSPNIFFLSEKNIRDKMDFFVKEAGCELSYVVRRPVLFTCSLERRLVPRHLIMKFLQKEGLLSEGLDFQYIVILAEENFVSKLVLPHEEKFPGFHEAYIAACAGKISTSYFDRAAKREA